MKQKTNVREKRNSEALRRKEALSSGMKQISGNDPKAESKPEKISSPKPVPVESSPAVSSEEEIHEFLAYLDKHGVPESAMDSTVTGEKSMVPPK